MPHLTAQCARCQADFAIEVRPDEIHKNKDGTFRADNWEFVDWCNCNDSVPQVHEDAVGDLLDRHRDTEREWAEGARLRAEAAREQAAEWRRNP